MQVNEGDKPDELRLFAECKAEIELLKQMRDAGIELIKFEDGGEWGWAEITIRPRS